MLVVVLVLVVLMSVAAYGYVLAMQTENIAARASGDQLIAQQAAFSARDWLAVTLELPRSQRELSGNIPSHPAQHGGVPIDERGDLLGRESARGVIVTRETVAEQVDPALGAINESSKLHLLKLAEWDAIDPGTGRTALMRLPGMDEATADAILDWIDADAEPRFEGAEAAWYSTLGGPRNGRPLVLDELLYVRGVDSRRLFGADRHTGVANRDAIDTGHVSQLNDQFVPWLDYLTIYSAERNESREGAQRINLNQSQLDLLRQQLSERLPIEWANFIVLFRQYGPDESADPSDASQTEVTVDLSVSASYNIRSPLELFDAVVSVPDDGGKKRVIRSPLQLVTAQSQVPQLIDQTSTEEARVLMGRVNVSQAPREVLLAIPGIDEPLVERILAARSIADNPVLGRDHDAWLLTEGVVDLETMQTLLSHVTAGGDVYRAEFWGYVTWNAPMFGFEAVLDATRGATDQVYFRELAQPPMSFHMQFSEGLSPESTSPAIRGGGSTKGPSSAAAMRQNF